jgi:hypothetical protein
MIAGIFGGLHLVGTKNFPKPIRAIARHIPGTIRSYPRHDCWRIAREKFGFLNPSFSTKVSAS